MRALCLAGVLLAACDEASPPPAAPPTAVKPSVQAAEPEQPDSGWMEERRARLEKRAFQQPCAKYIVRGGGDAGTIVPVDWPCR